MNKNILSRCHSFKQFMCLIKSSIPMRGLKGHTSKDNNQSLFDFGILVKRSHNKIKEGHTYSACSVIRNTTQPISGLLHCSVTSLSTITHTRTHKSYNHLHYFIHPLSGQTYSV